METRVLSDQIKEEKYAKVVAKVKALTENESDIIANMANVSAVLKDEFDFWWVGFYRVMDDRLVLGPFQGPLACTRIPYGKGVCGTSWEKAETIVVEDVELFPGHIACSSESRSEIVVPIIVDGVVKAVLDIDSRLVGNFNNVDKKHLEEVCQAFVPLYKNSEIPS